MKQYEVVTADNWLDLEINISKAAADGFHVAHMTQSEDGHVIHYTVCLEREVEG